MRYRVPSNSIECLLITPVTCPFLKLAVDLLLGDFAQTESPMLYVHSGVCGVNSLYSNPLCIDDISWCSWHIIFWHYIVPIYCLHCFLDKTFFTLLFWYFWWHVHTQELKANLTLIWRLLELVSTESRVVYENLLWWTFLKKENTASSWWIMLEFWKAVVARLKIGLDHSH